MEQVADLAGGMHDDTDGPSDQMYLTFELTDSDTLIGHQGENYSLSTRQPSIAGTKRVVGS